MSQKTLGQIRHVLSLIGGCLVSLGLLDRPDATTAIDGVIIAIGVSSAIFAHVWSWWSKSDVETELVPLVPPPPPPQ